MGFYNGSTLGDFYELYGVWWVCGDVWLSMVSIICRVLAGPCMCMSWGGCLGCRLLLGYSTLSVCWIGVCGLIGVLLCCVRLCEGLLCVGWCRCDLESISWFGQSVQLGLGYVSGQGMFFQWLPIYWAYRNLKVCVICAVEFYVAFQKWFESIWLNCSLDTHLSTYVNLYFAIRNSCLRWYLFMYVWKLWISL